MRHISPYKNKRVIEHFMKDEAAKGKHTKYVVLLDGYQVLTSRDVYNVKARTDEERADIAKTWPSDCPKLVHRSQLQKYMPAEHAKQFWSAGMPRL